MLNSILDLSNAEVERSYGHFATEVCPLLFGVSSGNLWG